MLDTPRPNNGYPAHHHAAINAVIRDDTTARRVVADSLRRYRVENRDTARKFKAYLEWLGWPLRLRSNGHFR